MKHILKIGFVFVFSLCSFSQTKISGVLKTENGKALSRASITITKVGTNTILDYDVSNTNGFFSISIKNKNPKLQLNIRSIGYKNVIKTIENTTQTQNFTLVEEITELKEVFLKSNPITRKGDTISYSVKSFTKKEDRTIADVLKNMPGIEVLPDGKVIYQGKPINKYYIEGLDLLEGKYNLANNNLPHKEVIKIQVLENHQPIKILDSLVYSDRAALNIKLKNSYTFTGQANIGTGYNPLLWDVNTTPMLFSKKQQMLSSYQTNNVGNNVAKQLKTLTIEELLDQFERNNTKQDWLSIQKLAIPNFSEQRWLDNNIHLFTANYLQKIKKEYELRLNISYLNDYQQQKGFTNTHFFITNDTITLFEDTYNKVYTNTIETNITLQKNTAKNYLKNSLIFQGFWDSQQGFIKLNSESVNQNLNNHYFKLSNDFKNFFPLGKQIATLNSYFGYNKTPQTLSVIPGQFKELLNEENSFTKLKQNVDLLTFYTNNSLGFTKGWKQFSFSPKVGFQFEKQHLKSDIVTSETQNSNFENNLDWVRSKFYVDLKTQYLKNKWKVDITTPINFHNYRIEDTELNKRQKFSKVTFEPRLSVNYELTSFWQIGTSANLKNQFGTINQVYYNYILQNYRNIKHISAPLPKKQNVNYATYLGYRNPLKSTFFSVTYSNIITKNNLLYSNNILNNGATELQAIEKENKRRSHSLIAKYSKYFSDFNTNILLKSNYSLQDFQQIINSEITDILNSNWHLNTKIDTDITDWLNAELESTWQISNNQIQTQKNQTITQQFHKFNVNIYPNENSFLAINTEFIKNDLFSKKEENLFTDLVYRYTLKKKNIDIEFQWNNIFNTNNYRTINIDNYSYIATNYTLRPRQILIKMKFSL